MLFRISKKEKEELIKKIESVEDRIKTAKNQINELEMRMLNLSDHIKDITKLVSSGFLLKKDTTIQSIIEEFYKSKELKDCIAQIKEEEKKHDLAVSVGLIREFTIKRGYLEDEVEDKSFWKHYIVRCIEVETNSSACIPIVFIYENYHVPLYFNKENMLAIFPIPIIVHNENMKFRLKCKDPFDRDIKIKTYGAILFVF